MNEDILILLWWQQQTTSKQAIYVTVFQFQLIFKIYLGLSISLSISKCPKAALFKKNTTRIFYIFGWRKNLAKNIYRVTHTFHCYEVKMPEFKVFLSNMGYF